MKFSKGDRVCIGENPEIFTVVSESEETNQSYVVTKPGKNYHYIIPSGYLKLAPAVLANIKGRFFVDPRGGTLPFAIQDSMLPKDLCYCSDERYATFICDLLNVSNKFLLATDIL